MLKLLTPQQLREADAYTILHEPIPSIGLMERAALKCTDWLCEHFSKETEFIVCCGPGNNGGDGFAIARLLLQADFSVKAISIGEESKFSENCKTNFNRLKIEFPSSLGVFSSIEAFPKITPNTVLIDAIFGTGLSREPEKPFTELMDWMTQSKATIVSIDIPSGMFVNHTLHKQSNKIIKANYTLTFQLPKLAFLLPNSGAYVGNFVLIDIALDTTFLAEAKCNSFLVEKKDIQQLIQKRPAFSHKGNYGHCLIIAGSDDKMGAAVLSTHACLRSGCGLTTALVPEKGRSIIQATLPEAMLFEGSGRIHASTNLAPFSAIGIGPGLGTSEEVEQELKIVIQNYRAPLVFDADAITIISKNKTWLGFFQNEIIFTPHLKEFERLTGKSEDDFHRLEVAKAFSSKYNIHLLLKGKYSCLICPDGNLYFNSTGNPGMAKGGSGDVLTGILAGLLAQGYSAKQACLIGMYAHGLAGDFAAHKYSETAMIASDIIGCLSDAFHQFEA